VEQNQSVINFSDKKNIKVALVGNPNSGKSTLFNALTGLHQKKVNFPGFTMDKKVGTVKLSASLTAEFTDLPGTYSLYPKSLDEKVTFDILCDPSNHDYPDVTIVVADASNLKRNLFFVSQLTDLRTPAILVLNMMDLVEKEGSEIDVVRLSEKLGIKVIAVTARSKQGIDEIKTALINPITIPQFDFINIKNIAPVLIEKIKSIIKVNSDFAAFQIINNFYKIDYFKKDSDKKNKIEQLLKDNKIDENKLQAEESIERYKVINRIVQECVREKSSIKTKSFTQKLDGLFTHKIMGYVFFLTILFFVFQSIFYLAQFPMQWIKDGFEFFSLWLQNTLPAGELADLLIYGIVAGLSGVIVFVPQIALLFAFISIMEDTGYMARVSFIMDKMLRKFGLNGRSVIPLISGVACAVPAIMSARTISNWKERMITILVTPLMSCSARLPVYTLLISVIAPKTQSNNFFNYQGMMLMGLYLIGFLAAIFAALVMKWVLKAKEKSYFIMELPVYRTPQWKTVTITILDKVKVFLWDAGKIIVAISIILWFLSSHASGDRFEKIEKKYAGINLPADEKQNLIATEKLEASYAGSFGKAIEPAIAPLGFDWKIGISLITSFAAREVFVGTMATIYSIGDKDDVKSIEEKMKAEINPVTGKHKYSFAVGISLLLFYAFAMQCMSTLAVVYRETKSWKWPAIQFLFMSALAYCSSLLAYQLLK